MSKPILHFQIPEWLFRRSGSHEGLQRIKVMREQLVSRYGDNYSITLSPLILQSDSTKHFNITIDENTNFEDFIRIFEKLMAPGFNYPADIMGEGLTCCELFLDDIFGRRTAYISKIKALNDNGSIQETADKFDGYGETFIVLMRTQGTQPFHLILMDNETHVKDITSAVVKLDDLYKSNPEKLSLFSRFIDGRSMGITRQVNKSGDVLYEDTGFIFQNNQEES